MSTGSPAAGRTDPALLEMWNHRLAQVCEEMGVALRRAAFSPNIKERRDYSCALFDGDGRLLAQAAHIPVHLGSTPLSVRAVLERLRLGDGEVAILNDPYAGGTHLPDVTLVAPVFASDPVRPLAYLANRAHHADVGGAAPGSMPLAAGSGPRTRALTVDDEGVRIPPTLLTDEVARRFCQASRAPEERSGDLAAQLAAIEVGRRHLLALADRHGEAAVAAQARALIAYGGRIMRATLAALPAGVYAFADSLDDDGAGQNDVALRVTVTLTHERAVVDFSESDDEVAGPLNAVYAVTLSSVLYAFRLLAPEDAPTNEGMLESISVVARAGSVVNPRPPRAVAAGNVETSQRIVDVVLGALAQALPSRIPAASAGTMNNLLIGSDTAAYYETIAGGAGASALGPGASAIHTHMTNTLNTPVEALEHALPVRVVRYALRRGSGGGGRHRGGDGVVREIELLADQAVTLIGERRLRPPYGLAGGGPGQTGEHLLERAGNVTHLPGKVLLDGRAGDRITVATPGGGGWGRAES